MFNDASLTPDLLHAPSLTLTGAVDYMMYENFRAQFALTSNETLTIIALSTLGGDPEVARLMGEDIRFQSQLSPERRIVFLGKAAVYSAGATFMSFFARRNRFITRGTRLMIHERNLIKTLILNGPLTSCVASVEATLNEIRASIAIQNEGFENLILGSKVTREEILQRALSTWYIEATEAVELGLVEAIV